MALRDYGKADNDLGEWYPFGVEAGLELRVRRVPHDVANRISRAHGKEETYRDSDGVRRREWVRTGDELQNMLVEQAIFALVDIRGPEAEIVVEDAEAAKLWGSHFKRDVAIGETVPLQGALTTDAIKRRLLVQIKPHAHVDMPIEEDGKPTGQTKRVLLDIGTFVLERAVAASNAVLKSEKAAESN